MLASRAKCCRPWVPAPVGAPLKPHSRLVPRVAEKDADIKAFLEKPDDAGIKAMTAELLESDPEVKEQLAKIQDAMARVDRAKAAEAELEREYEQAKLDSAKAAKQEELDRKRKADQIMADAEVAAAEKLLAAAELANAQAQLERARLEAEITNDAGRVESAKAAAAAVLGGTAGVLPFLVMSSETGINAALSLVAALASCALFGVTYRWCVGNSPDNVQLRGGVVAAFGLVRGASAADVLQLSSAGSPFTLDVIGSSALYAGQSMLMFAFAAAAIEAALRQGLIRLVDEPAGQTNSAASDK